MKRRILAAILLAVPLLAGAITAGATNVDISKSWNDSEESAGAPIAVVDQDAIIAAHRAAGEAASQGSFLSMGTKQLADGTQELGAGADELAAGTQAARSGADELAAGLVQLQAATGQLGTGATELADGIDQAAAVTTGLEAVRGQIIVAIDDTIADLQDSIDPRSRETITELEDLRAQAQNFEINPETTAQLQAAQSGAREMANQLAVPGYGYHDGIYSATKGAQELASGLAELEDGVGQAVAGIKELEDGATQVDQMATSTRDRIDQVQRALPIVATANPAADDEGTTSQILPPLYAFFIAGFVMFAAVTWRRGSWVLSLISGLVIAALAGALVAILGAGITLGSVIGAGVIAGIALVAAAAGTVVFTRIFGTVPGIAIAVVLLAGQAALVGWVWNEALTQTLGSGWEFIVRLFPLHYATAAISTVGNGIWGPNLWLSAGVLAAFGVVAILLSRFMVPARPLPKHFHQEDLEEVAADNS
ncbi:MAG: hypothetical protein Q3976_02950 [Corynebacterium sp.]|nr:hypothetical protein [Corynebacterium sp.]